jgi:3-hydroxymyristoyl/3-hydroxydecanoyl-(acyl carrier protein) dehydratase
MKDRADTSDDRRPVVLEARQSPGEVILDIFVPDTLFYFRGHFPGYAILPGVVQLDWAVQFGRHYRLIEEAASQIVRVKFRQPIRPQEQLRLRLSYAREERRLSFDYGDARGQRSLGQIMLAPS